MELASCIPYALGHPRIVGVSKDKKIDFFGRFFAEKSVFGGGGKDFQVEKSSAKKSEKNRQKSPIFWKKSDIFPKKSDFSRYLCKLYFRSLRE